MRRFFTLLLCNFLFQLSVQKVYSQTRVVILGSSTAEGVGATPGNSWASKYKVYLEGLNPNNEVINLAKSSYTTYHVMPNGNSVINRPEPDLERNITKALSLAPDVIIVNLPTNDADRLHTVQEILDNYNTIKTLSDAQNVAVYYTSTQPRNFTGQGVNSVTKRQLLVDISNATQAAYSANYIDFWTGLAEADGTIKPEYDSGDGIHIKDAAHDILFNRVKNVASILMHGRSNLETEYINLDFGDVLTNHTEWNVITNSQTGKNNSLINTVGSKSGIYAWVHDNFDNNFSTGGTDVVGLPNDVSQDGFYGSGTNATNSTGGITLGGLSANKKYTLTFFASRTGNTDNRETKFSIQGQTLVEQSVNSSANTSQFVVFNDVKADATGFISITVQAGVNNNNATKFFYVNSLQITAQSEVPVINPGTSGKILIDFGSSAKTTSGNWNNFTDGREVDVRKDLINTTGALTGYKIYIHDAFSAFNPDGTTNHATYPADATSDSFYGNNVAFGGFTEPTAGVTLEDLDETKEYRLTFYGSRMSVSDNRETQFTVTGNTTQTVYLQTANNQNNSVTVADILPDANGKIVVSITFGPNNNNGSKFFYIGVLDIDYAPAGTLPVNLQGFKGETTNGGVLLEWETLSESNNSHFEILRIEDGTEKVLGTVTSKGNGSTLNYYTFVDKNPDTGVNYYQLRQVDINGAVEKSVTVSVNSFYRPLSAKAWFNSTGMQLQITSEKGGEAQLSLTDIGGRNLFSDKVRLQEGINENTIHLNFVPAGTYILNIYQDGKAKSLKINKD